MAPGLGIKLDVFLEEESVGFSWGDVIVDRKRRNEAERKRRRAIDLDDASDDDRPSEDEPKRNAFDLRRKIDDRYRR